MDGRIKEETNKFTEVYTEEVTITRIGSQILVDIEWQKQYFEQRRRQQQQLPTYAEGYTDEANNSCLHQKESRSLDVLSLLNFSTTAVVSKSSGLRDDLELLREMGEPDGCTSSLKYDISKDPIRISDETCVFQPPETTGECTKTNLGSSSGYKELYASSKKIPENHISNLSGADEKTDLLMATTEQKLSIFDLVGDEAPNINLERNGVNESHVAFSVEGLGRVGTVTPPLSPQQPNRIFSCEYPSPWKTTCQPKLSNFDNKHKNIELEVDEMLENISTFSGKMRMRDADSGLQQKNPNVTLHTPHNSKSRRYFDDITDFADIQSDAYRCEGEYDEPWKEWQPNQENDIFFDFLKYGNVCYSDHSSLGHHPMTKRKIMEATSSSFFSDSSAYRQQTPECNHVYPSPDETLHFQSGKKLNFRDVAEQPVGSHFVAEKDMDDLSFLSEESSSSTTARREQAGHSLWDSTVRHRRRRLDSFCSIEGKNGLEHCLTEKTLWDGEHGNQPKKRSNGYAKCAGASKTGKSKPTSLMPTSFQEDLEFSKTCFGSRSTSGDMNSDFPFPERKLPSPNPSPWCKRPFDACLNPHASESSSKNHKRDKFEGYSPLLSEKLAFSHQFMQLDFHDPAVFSDFAPEDAKSNVLLDFKLGNKLQRSSRFTGSVRETGPPKLSVQGCSGKEGNESAVISPAKRLSELWQGVSNRNFDKFPANGKEITASYSVGDNIEIREAEDGSDLKENSKATEEQGEQTSSSVKIPEKSESLSDKNEYDHCLEQPVHYPEGSKETEDAKWIRGAIASSRKNSVGSSHQAIILESSVLRLLCVKKGIGGGHQSLA